VVEVFRSLSRLVSLVLFFLIVDCGYPLFLVPNTPRAPDYSVANPKCWLLEDTELV
jgi:hypothetical protein